jgi:hypothetical protein
MVGDRGATTTLMKMMTKQQSTNVQRQRQRVASADAGGPAGEFPANIFESAKIQENILRSKNQKKQMDHRLIGGPNLSTAFSPPPW